MRVTKGSSGWLREDEDGSWWLRMAHGGLDSERRQMRLYSFLSFIGSSSPPGSSPSLASSEGVSSAQECL
jgi:hypothetical protein